MSQPLTIQETADRLCKSKRWLLEWLRKHPADKGGEPYYTPVGRDKIFHQTDIARIEGALRGEIQCRLSSGRPAQVKRRISRSEVPTGAITDRSAWKLAAELTSDPTLLSFSNGSKNASTNTDAGQSRSPSLRIIQGSQHS